MRLLAVVAACGALAAVAVSIATGTDPLPVTTTAHVQAAEAAPVTDCEVVTGNDHVMELAVRRGDAVVPYMGTFTYASEGVTTSHGADDPRTITTAGGVTAGKATFGWKANLPVDVIFVSSTKDDGSTATWRYTYTQYDWGGHPATGPFEDAGLAAPGATISSILFCTLKKVRVEVSAAPTFTRAYTWKVENAVVAKANAAADDAGFAKAATLDLETGSTGDATWRVTTTRTGQADSGFALTGAVTILNATPFTMNLDSSLTGVPGAALEGPCAAGRIMDVQRGSRITCTYAAPSLPNGNTLTPTAGVTFDEPGLDYVNGSATATASFSTPTAELHRSVRWADSIDPGVAVNQQRTGITGSPDVFTYPQTKLCDRDKGSQSITVRLVSEDPGALAFNSDTSTLTVRCTTPVKPLVIAGASSSLDWQRITRWTIAERAVPPSHALQPGQTGTSDWNIDVQRVGTDNFVLLTGAFEVQNPNGIAISGVTVPKPFANATVQCAVGNGQAASVEGRTFTIPAGGALRCTWSVDRATADGGSFALNVTSSGTPGANVTGTVSWSGLASPNRGDINPTVVVDDDRTPQRWNASTSTDGDRAIPETFPCANAAYTNVPRILGDNPATQAIESDFVLGSATATVTTTCDTTPPGDRRIDVAVRVQAPAQLAIGPGGQTPYEVTLAFRNNGPNQATNVVMTNTAPAGVVYTGVTQQPAQGTCVVVDAAGQPVTGNQTGVALRCELGTLAPGQALEGVRVGARATGSGTFTTVAVINGQGGPDTNLQNNTDRAVTVIVDPTPGDRRIDVATTITAPDRLNLGPNGTTAFDYGISFRNNGPDQATSVVATSTAPAGVVYTSIARQPAQGTCVIVDGGAGVRCELGTLAAGQAVEGLLVGARATGTGSFTAVATINGQGGPDTNPLNNVSQATTVIVGPNPPGDPRIDVAVTLTAPSALTLGPNGTTPIEYGLVFRNNGPDTARNVVSTVAAPPGVVYTSIDRQPSQGTCSIVANGAAIRCELGTIEPGQVITGATATGRATGTGTFTNVAVINGEGGPDTNLLNNVSIAQTVISGTPPPPNAPRIDAAVTMTGPSLLTQGPGGVTSLTYGYGFRNNGPDPATNVVVTSTAPPGVTYTSIDRQPSQGRCEIVDGGASVRCELGTLQPGQVVDGLLVGARATGTGTFTNIVVINGQGGPDTNPANNVAQLQTTIVAGPSPDPRMDVAVTVTAPGVLPQGPNGQTAYDYVYSFRNNGPDEARNVVAVTSAPPGVVFTGINRQPAQGTCTIVDGGAALRCELGTLAPGQILGGVSVAARATGTGVFVDVVTISGQGAVDVNPTNDVAVAQTVILGTPPNPGDPRMDVSVAITSPSTLNQGPNGVTVFDYGFAFANNGPNQATSVIVTNTAPPGVTYTGIVRQPSQGTCRLVNEGRGMVCELGTVEPGQVVTGLTVQARATGSGTFTNIVTINGQPFDTNLGNNVAQTTTLVVPALQPPVVPPAADPRIDTAVTVTAPGQLSQGTGGVTTFQYGYTFGNNGPNTATDVVAIATAPPGVTFTSVVRQPSQGTCTITDAGRTLRCELGTLAPGQVIGGVTVAARTQQLGTFTSVVTIDGKGGPDANPLNNTAVVQTLIIGANTPPVREPRIDIEVRHGGPGKVVIKRGAKSATYAYSYTFRNNGPNTSTNVIVRTSAPRGVKFVKITRGPSQGVCKITAGGKRITCWLGTMRNGTSVGLRVDARATKAGVYRTVVTGSGRGGADTNLGNNRANAQVVVIREATPATPAKPAKPKPPKPPVVQCYAPRSSVRTLPAAKAASVTFTVVGSNGTRLAGARLRVVGPGIDRVLRAGASGRVAATLRPSAGGIVTVSVVGVKQCSDTRIGVIVPREPIVTG